MQQQQKNKSGSPLGPPSLTSPTFPDSVIRTGALPHINSSIIQTANSQLLANSQILAHSQLLANSPPHSKMLPNSQMLANAQAQANSQILTNNAQANSQMLASPQTSSQMLANAQVKSQMLASPQANSLASFQENSQLLANYSQPLPGKLPPSLSGLLSPRHTRLADTHSPQNSGNGNRSESSALPPPPARQASSQPTLVSPARMMPATFSPSVSAGTGNRSPSGLVYLRQDQNIPESFCDKFRPIEPASDKAASVDIKNISSDDIVVTLHSVNV